MRKTKIVCTLGPATNSVDMIKKLIGSGLDAARINFSHGSHESHKETIEMLKTARKELKKPIPLLLDTKGPEIRIKLIKGDKVFLERGQTFTLTTRDIEGTNEIAAVTYEDLPNDIDVGGKILLDDGLIELSVKEIDGTEIVCTVENEGNLSSRKGVNVPDVYVNLPSLTEKDIEDIKFGIEMGFDYIAASFVRSASDVINIRNVLEENGGKDIHIIAKIESRDGVNNLDEILDVADGIMVARGDLGVELNPEEVPVIQKELIRKANAKSKPVITATQMLESMVKNPRPTRAEANDVANAIYDGSDAIMLSGETAMGAFPVEAVAMMARIAVQTEDSIDYKEQMGDHRIDHNKEHLTNTNAISYAACSTASDLKAACIVTFTESGFSARMVSKFRPNCPIVGLTTSETIWRKMNLTWGCIPTISKEILKDDDVFEMSTKIAEKLKLATPGDAVVITAGIPVHGGGTTNTLRIDFIGNVFAKGTGIGTKSVSGRSNVIKMSKTENASKKEFKKGDILVVDRTNDDMMYYIRRAGAIIVGNGQKKSAHEHTITVGQVLDIPVIICKEKITDLIPSGIPITVDSKDGFVYNGLSVKNSNNNK